MKTGKNYLFIGYMIVFIQLIVQNAEAQKIELSPFIGYETGGKLRTTAGFLYVGGGVDYGGSFNYTFSKGSQVELSYSHLKSNLDVDEGYNRVRVCDLAVDFYSVGGLKEIRPGEMVNPYALISLGLVNYRPLEGDYSNATLMHFSFAGGVKFPVSDRIGFRLQARFLMPIWSEGKYFYDDSSSDGAVTGTKPGLIQGDFTAAVIFAIK
jgi:hypothetical protein